VLQSVLPSVIVLPASIDAPEATQVLSIQLTGLDDRIGTNIPNGSLTNSSEIQILIGETLECMNARRLTDGSQFNQIECELPLKDFDANANEVIRSISVAILVAG